MLNLSKPVKKAQNVRRYPGSPLPVVDILSPTKGHVVGVQGQRADTAVKGHALAQGRVDVVPAQIRVLGDERAQVLKPVYHSRQPGGLCNVGIVDP